MKKKEEPKQEPPPSPAAFSPHFPPVRFSGFSGRTSDAGLVALQERHAAAVPEGPGAGAERGGQGPPRQAGGAAGGGRGGGRCGWEGGGRRGGGILDFLRGRELCPKWQRGHPYEGVPLFEVAFDLFIRLPRACAGSNICLKGRLQMKHITGFHFKGEEGSTLATFGQRATLHQARVCRRQMSKWGFQA